MITCPNCAHPNPDGAVNCEACFTPLPIVKIIQCPSCNETVLSDAKFCGHCGFNLSAATALIPHVEVNTESGGSKSSIDPSTEIFPVLPISNAMSNSLPDETTEGNTAGKFPTSSISSIPTVPKETEIEGLIEAESNKAAVNIAASAPISVKTQLQQFSASLLHVQTNLTIEIPVQLPVVHIGKPNTVIPPDIDVSGFPDSDIVSRIHADIRAEGGSFYFEDTGSSNGTYINNLPLPAGNRHKLRAGDRISLGKGDKVSFVFQLTP
jgi:hypothetical protein